MSDLDTFLKGDEPAPAPAPEAAPQPAEAPAVEVKAEPAEPAAEPTEPVATDPEAHLPDDVKGLRAALQSERTKRQDHKGRGDRLEGELAAIRTELAEAKTRAAAAALLPVAPPAPVATPVIEQIPDPVEDPVGYARYVAKAEAKVESRKAAFEMRLDLTEEALKEKEGDEAVEAAKKTFLEMAKVNPALGAELWNKPNPYRWMWQQVKAAELAKKVSDPEYEVKMRSDAEAAIRAQYEAKYGPLDEVEAAPAPAAPPVKLPQSLGAARTAQARSAPVWSGPPPLEALFPGR